MIRKELADPFGLFFKYRKIFFSNIVISLLIGNDTANLKTKKVTVFLGLEDKRKAPILIDWGFLLLTPKIT